MRLWELLDCTAEARPFDAPDFVGLELGEEFKVISSEKAPVYRVKSLEIALSVLRSEMEHDPQADIRVVLRGPQLCVSMVRELGRPWGRNIPRTIEDLRLAVSQFSMGEGWPETINGMRINVAPRSPWKDVDPTKRRYDPWI